MWSDVANSFVDEYSESMKRNQVLASSAIKRAMADANAGKLLFLSFFWSHPFAYKSALI